MNNGPWKQSFKICPTKSIVFLLLMIFISLFFSRTNSMAETNVWQKLAEGLYLGEFDPGMKSKICNHEIVIIRIEPRSYYLKLLSASEHDRKTRTAKAWCNEFGLLAAINASMYQNMEPLRSTGYMRNDRYFNNPYINPAFGAFLCFDPVDSSLPDVQIVDRRLQKDWKRVIKGYNTVVQNYRMISDGKKRGWPQREEVYGSAAIGMDKDNHVLFILSRSPFSTHDLIHILLSLPIRIKSAMYVEGGPEATLYLKVNEKEMTLMATCETDSKEHDKQESAQAIPNVIGVVRR